MQRFKRILKDWGPPILIVLVIRFFIIEPYRIPSPSMEDTLLVGDFLFATKFDYGVKLPFVLTCITPWWQPKPQRGQIVIFRSPFERRNVVKRCIAVEGDTIEIRDKKVYINGKPLDEPYVKFNDPIVYPPFRIPNYQEHWEHGDFKRYIGVRDNFGPVVVPKDCIFVMGDNRDNSYDSRFWGPLPVRYLLGRPLIIWLSWQPDLPVYIFWKKIRWKRIGRILRWR